MTERKISLPALRREIRIGWHLFRLWEPQRWGELLNRKGEVMKAGSNQVMCLLATAAAGLAMQLQQSFCSTGQGVTCDCCGTCDALANVSAALQQLASESEDQSGKETKQPAPAEEQAPARGQ